VLDAQGRLVGVVDESDVLMHVQSDAAHFRDPVSHAMSASPHTLAPNATLAELRAVLARGLTAIIADDHGFHGLITRFDLLNHLRRTIR
jgi:cystathionine beta-synthase